MHYIKAMPIIANALKPTDQICRFKGVLRFLTVNNASVYRASADYLPSFFNQLRGFLRIDFKPPSLDGLTTGDMPMVFEYFVDTCGWASASLRCWRCLRERFLGLDCCLSPCLADFSPFDAFSPF